MLDAYQMRLKYKNKYLLKVASFFLDTLYFNLRRISFLKIFIVFNEIME